MAVAKKPKSSKSKVEVKAPAVPVEHVMVPKVAQANEEEVKSLFEEKKVTRDKLPLIKRDDPAVLYLNLHPGDVVKFTRISLASGDPAYYYRLVVE